ncbi:radical SAM family heme chaperone HemW [Clostridium sp. FP2]|uniref:radical SAM family heme chaperone HemW n=1 Tax=Clostridium TaxID=1485 RepID=UPI0013E906DE|nr:MULTISPECIES: radical SAM family heme chaperone HemW [Clostridium]MBW9155048.1 radical SAM family heme chaperone HemW [Clostridium tagluense]MBZ9624660.1 radical SAM family heme chaperone HemW [Clostridium sp. FP2]WLC64494.1 radical SAM family heme chaperone HemW [Clostridium tagluense]
MKNVALYIHIPFCMQKCLYCDFPSFAGKEEHMLHYCAALAKEISSIKNKKIKTIFIGGGTPTYLSLEGWEIIKESIDRLDTTGGLEFTVEGNPGTFTMEKLEFFKKMGVNRLSIGLQAFQDSLLKSLGRIHTVEDFKQSFEMARKLGFNNINVDLMFGLPSQTFSQWQETLKNVTELKPEHLSCYSLIVEEGTAFYKKFKQGTLNLPDEEIDRAMYHETIEYLSGKGYIQYEISNFAKDKMACRHNLVYWEMEEYIGCGSASHSYIDGFRYRNDENVEAYMEKINASGSAIVEKKKNSTKDDMEEFMFMGLRKIMGISKSQFQKRFNIDIHSVYEVVINKYTSNGFMVENDDNIFLTYEGIEVSNVIMSEFLLS